MIDQHKYIVGYFILICLISSSLCRELLSLCWCNVNQIGNFEYKIILPIFSNPPSLDGKINELVWDNATILSDFTEFEPVEGINPPVETEVLLGYDADNLYIGFRIFETDIAEIRASMKNRDEYTNDDEVWIFLDTFSDFQTYYLFIVNPYGIQIDIYSDNPGFDANWQSAACIMSDRWEAEVAIPFKSLQYPNIEEQHWKVNFFRVRPRASIERYSWAPISKSNPSILAQAGDIFFSIQEGQNNAFDFLPFLVAGQTANLENSGNAILSGFEDINLKIGFSTKYKITSDVMLEATINPDYSQIETDASQIDVNTTFAFYYPEKRPFFMEGCDIFVSPLKAIYTRSINDPLAATKVISKIKKTSIGYIFAYDRHTSWLLPFHDCSYTVISELKCYNNIARLKHHILKGSYVGILASSRDMEEYHNRLIGFDCDIWFLTNHNITLQGIKSWTKEINDTLLFPGYSWLDGYNYTSRFDGEEFEGTALFSYLARHGKHWNFGISGEIFSPTYRADNGFVDRNDYAKIYLTTNIHQRINNKLFEKFTPQLEFWRMYDYSGTFRENHILPKLSIILKHQTVVSFYCDLYSKTFTDVYFKNISKVGIKIGTEFCKYVSLGVLGQMGEDINYYATPPTAGIFRYIKPSITINPTHKLKLEVIYERYWFFESIYNSEIYDVTIINSELSYQFFKNLSVRLTTQFNSYLKDINIYPLLSYEPTPFTVLYLGSNHTFDVFNDKQNYEQSRQHIFLKVQCFISF